MKKYAEKYSFESYLNEIKNRGKFLFTVKEIFKNVLPCWRSSRVKKFKKNDTFRNHYLVHKGCQKLDNEFDAIHMIKLMKQVKLLVKVLLNPTQKMLLGFQKQNVLDSESSDNEGNESDEDDVMMVSKMKSANEFIRVLTLGNIQKKLQSYFHEDTKFSAVDLRLMAGIFKKKVILKNKQRRATLKQLLTFDSNFFKKEETQVEVQPEKTVSGSNGPKLLSKKTLKGLKEFDTLDDEEIVESFFNEG